MSVVRMNALAQAFGAFTVFSNFNGSIEPGEKVGLVGPNGIGKTTLLLVLSGITQPYEGSVNIANNTRIGYLRQEAVDAFAEKENTVFDEMLTVFAGMTAKEERLRELEGMMSVDCTDAVLEEYGTLQEEFDRLGGYDYEVRIKQTLSGLGFDQRLYDTPLLHLSGGQKTRALLARLLLEMPDLLILDEPTNHLDMRAVEWLETALKNWPGALLIASHDRYFLDSVIETTWEMSRTGLEIYKGNYSAYLRQREERFEHQEKVFNTEWARLRTELNFVKANIARQSTNAMAVGKLRLLSRDLIAIQKMGLMAYKAAKNWSSTDIGSIRPLSVAEAEDALKNFKTPNIRPPKLAMRLKPTYRSGDTVLRAKQLKIGYPDRPLFDAEELMLTRGECAALIGGNGAGKTTFIKTMLNEIPAMHGGITLGTGVKIGYFAQAHNNLEPENNVVDEFQRHNPMLISEARKHLAAYLFRGDDVYKPVGKLSGGERGRLALAILATKGANCLLLDEPTNHLDIPAQEVLQQVFDVYDGTILLISHDRYLIDRLATQIWEVENGRLTVFQGDYKAYLVARDAKRIAAKAERAAAAPEKPIRKANHAPKTSSDLEQKISRAESKIAEIERLLNGKCSPDEAIRYSQQYAEQQAALAAFMAEWESAGVEQPA